MKIQLNRLTTPFDLENTLSCGQAFRWEKLGSWWYGIVKEKVVKIKQTSEGLEFQTYPETIDADFVRNYFRLDDDLPHIISKINKDECIGKAIRELLGLRIIRQEPWECLISYICATYKNIPAIQKIILNLSKRFGKKMKFDGYDFYTFPKPSDLVEASVEEIKRCKLGFRSSRVSETSKIIDCGEFSLDDMKKTDYEKARCELLTLPGVGEKVADCVLLFSLEKLEAFPVDVWMKRIILESYSSHFEKNFVRQALGKNSVTPSQYRKIGLFGRKYFGEYAGYAQEYLFHYFRRAKT